MTEPNGETTDEPFDGRLNEWTGLDRRTLLQALGAGTALSLGGGTAVAAGGGVATMESDDEDGDESDRIDPQFGYSTMDVADLPEDLASDHEVELAIAPPAGAGQPPFLYFDPVGLHVDAGDVVQFTFLSPDHSVTAMHSDIGLGSRVPEESPPFSSPVMGPGAAWLYRFEAEGVYDLYCGPHLDFGMVMRVVVGDLAEEDLPEYARSVEDLPSSEDVSRGLNQLSEGNEDCEWPFVMPDEILGADALDPMSVQDTGEVAFGTVVEELGYELQPPEEPAEEEGNATGAENTTEGDAANATDDGGDGGGYDG